MNDLKKRKRIKFPSAVVILFILVVLVSLLSYIIPAGQFVREVDPVTNITKVDPNSYHRVEATPVTFMQLFFNIQRGFVEAGSVIFLIFFAYFCVYSITLSGAFYGGINSLLKVLKGKESLIIPIFFLVFALAGSTYGEWDTIFGLIPIFVGLCIALGYDAMVGLAVSGMAVAIGFASATTNPFTIGIAQSISELPIFSGLLYRIVIFCVMSGASIWWIMRYAKKVKADPQSSLVSDIDFGKMKFDSDKLENTNFSIKHKLILIVLFATIGFIVYSSLTWGWYIDEMAGIFLLSGIVVSLIHGFSLDEIGKNMIDSFSAMIVAIIVVGLSRAVTVTLQSTNIIDTVIYGMYQPLSKMPLWISSIGMLIMQTILNLFIPSGSGQAAAIMPIMVPLSDLANLTRQTAVLAFQFGDGYSNLLWPTGGIVVMAGIAQVPIDRWYKFFLKLYGILLVLQIIFLVIATIMNYGPY